MTKEDFKCILIQKYIDAYSEFPSTEDLVNIQKLADFAFNGE